MPETTSIFYRIFTGFKAEPTVCRVAKRIGARYLESK
jgi:hypothetical protein